MFIKVLVLAHFRVFQTIEVSLLFQKMGILFEEKLFVIINFFFLLESWACFGGSVVVDVSDVVALRCFTLVVSLAGHWLLCVLGHEGSFIGTA